MTKKILILGAGKSSPYLVKYLYNKRLELNITIEIISDKKPKYISDFEEITYHKIDIKDELKLSKKIKEVFIIVSLLPPSLHYYVAKISSKLGTSMITASYLNDDIKSLENNFKKNNCFLFMEMGLDP